jgi:hypothetical protein
MEGKLATGFDAYPPFVRAVNSALGSVPQKEQDHTSWIYCVYSRRACSGVMELFAWGELIREGKSIGD